MAAGSPALVISIHAPVKGATSSLVPGTPSSPAISIHAPVKGATRRARTAVTRSGFQSTLPRRERRRHSQMLLHRMQFQSTLPRMERPPDPEPVVIGEKFQSTLPRRERLRRTRTRFQQLCISIHAPAKGATQALPPIAVLRRYFNPRSREGSDPLHWLLWLPVRYFNPRSREGSD